jgi:hypothetical protein
MRKVQTQELVHQINAIQNEIENEKPYPLVKKQTQQVISADQIKPKHAMPKQPEPLVH